MHGVDGFDHDTFPNPDTQVRSGDRQKQTQVGILRGQIGHRQCGQLTSQTLTLLHRRQVVGSLSLQKGEDGQCPHHDGDDCRADTDDQTPAGSLL
jgi:hypothetical protein